MKTAELIHQPAPEFGDCCETCKEPRKDKVASQNCKVSISIDKRHSNF